MTVTIDDIAREAGVSTATVSYVINNNEKVGPETRKKVLQIIEKRDYHPNSSARNLARKKTEVLGLIVPEVTGVFYADIVQGVEDAAFQNNFTLYLGTTNAKKEREKMMIDHFSGNRVDGLILTTYFINKNYIKELKNRDLDFVFIGNPVKDDSVSTVVVDNFSSGYRAAEHLINLGHKKIAFIKGDPNSWDAEERFAGFKAVMNNYDLEINNDYIKTGNYQQEEGYKAAQELFNLEVKPTAVFASNDQMAMGVYKAAQENNIKIPEQLSVVGFDDIAAASHLNPPLTTVNQPTYRMGQKAVEILIKKIKGQKVSEENIVFETEFIKRNSSQKKSKIF